MKNYYFFLPFICFLFFNVFGLKAQEGGDIDLVTRASGPINIAYESITISVEITNNTAYRLFPKELDPGLPQGVSYVSGTISGMEESGEMNVQSPLFVYSGDSLETDQTIYVEYKIEAYCELLDFVEASFDDPYGGYVVNNTELVYSVNGENKRYAETYGSESYSVLSPDVELFVRGDNINVESLLTDKPFNRNIMVINSGFGVTKALTLTIEKDENLTFNNLYLTDKEYQVIATLSPYSSTSTKLIYIIDDFSNVGDNDDLFEKDEVIYLMDDVNVMTSGCYPSYSTSYSVRWGDGNRACNDGDSEADFNAYINIPEGKFNISRSSSITRGEYCKDNFKRTFTITNTGNGSENPKFDALFDFRINIRSYISGAVTSVAVLTSNDAEVTLWNSPSDGYHDLEGLFSYDFDGPGGFDDVDGDGYYDDLPVGNTASVIVHGSGANITSNQTLYSVYLYGKHSCNLFNSIFSQFYSYSDSYSYSISTPTFTDLENDTINNTTDYKLYFSGYDYGSYFSNRGYDKRCIIDLPQGLGCFDLELLSGTTAERDSFTYEVDGQTVSFNAPETRSSFNVKLKTTHDCPDNYSLEDDIISASVVLNTCGAGSVARTGIKQLEHLECLDNCLFSINQSKLERKVLGYEYASKYTYHDVFESGDVAKVNPAEDSTIALNTVTQKDILVGTFEAVVQEEADIDDLSYEINYNPTSTSYKLFNFDTCTITINGGNPIGIDAGYVNESLSSSLHNLKITIPLGEMGLPNVLGIGDVVKLHLELKVPNLSANYKTFEGVTTLMNYTVNDATYSCYASFETINYYRTYTSNYDYSWDVDDANNVSPYLRFYDGNYGYLFLKNESRFSSYLKKVTITIPNGFDFNVGDKLTYKTSVGDYAAKVTSVSGNVLVAEFDSDQIPLRSNQTLDGSLYFNAKLNDSFDFPPLGVDRSYRYTINYDYVRYVHLDKTEHETVSKSTYGYFRYKSSKGFTLTTNTIQEGYDKVVEWPVQLATFGNTGSIANTYIAVELRPEDKSTVLKGIVNQNGDTLDVSFYGPANELNPEGRYMMANVGSITSSTKSYKVIAGYRNCEDDVLQEIDIYAGWHNFSSVLGTSSSVYTLNSEQFPLQKDTLIIRYRTANLQWSIDQSTNWKVDLCEDVQFNVDLLSSKYANMDDVFLKVKLPDGITFVKDSLPYFAYNETSTLVNKKACIGDAEVEQETIDDHMFTVYTWNIEELLGRDFFGTRNHPMNNAKFMLNIATDCDGFDPGIPLQFETYGYTNCMDWINYKDQRKIHLNNFDIDNLSIKLSADEFTACNDKSRLYITVTNRGSNMSSYNELSVELDPQLRYLSNSSSDLSSFEISDDGLTLTWVMEEGLIAPDDSYSFYIEVQDNDLLASTGVHNYKVKTSMEGEFTCIKNGEICRLVATSGYASLKQISDVNPPYPAISSITDYPVCPGSTIRLEANVSNLKEGNYYYSWYLNNTLLKSGQDSYVDINDFRLTTLGDLKVMVTDPNGCTNDAIFELVEEYLYPEPLIAVDEIIQTTCANSVDASMSYHFEETEEGQAPFSYVIQKLDGTVIKEENDIEAGTPLYVDGLSAQTYRFTVIDALGCTTHKPVLVPNGGPVIRINCVSSLPCDVEDGDEVTLLFNFIVKRGRVLTPDYTYNLQNENGDNLLSVDGRASYNETVRDELTFTYSANSIYYIKITEDGAPCGEVDGKVVPLSNSSVAINLSDKYYRKCFNDQTAAISASLNFSVTGCTPIIGPFYFNLYRLDDNDAKTFIDKRVADEALSVEYSDLNLPEGTYYLEAFGNDPLIGDYVANDTLRVFDSDVSLSVNTTDVNCVGGNDGEAIAFIRGGTPPYQYYWYDSNDDLISSDPEAYSLYAGDYYLKFTDVSGCDIDNYQYDFTIEDGTALGDIYVDVPDEYSTSCEITAWVDPVVVGKNYTFQWVQLTQNEIFEETEPGVWATVQYDDENIVYSQTVSVEEGEELAISTRSLDEILPGYSYYIKVVDENNCFVSSEVFDVPVRKVERNYKICMNWQTLPSEFTQPTIPEVHYNAPKAIARDLLEDVQEAAAYCSRIAGQKSTKKYDEMCLSKETLDDELTLEYSTWGKHYTLYYYDRAGNLVKTVPPKGVNMLEGESISRENTPEHEFVTTYTYNSLGLLTAQTTPDSETTTFVYDDKGQLRFSQNSKQQSSGLYSYTKYDELGRVVEVGEGPISATESKAADASYPNATLEGLTNQTYTYYGGEPQVLCNGESQHFIMNRVSYTVHNNSDGEKVSTYYSYDPHGNVEWMVQDIPGLENKSVSYEYDLISGNVNQVTYNKGKHDQFIHRYEYDADNRILSLETSRDGVVWERDAQYNYYDHGPLSRVTLGQDEVQGLDYVYTLQGWLKAINHPELDPSKDPGHDGATNSNTAHDVFGMILSYYDGDFVNDNSHFDADRTTEIKPEHDLFNGNIGAWTHQQALKRDDGSLEYNQLNGQQFTYDQLNRIKQSKFSNYNNSTWSPTADYASNYSYDPNGNITSLSRVANNGRQMDELSYNYIDGKNQLGWVDDDVTNSDLFDDDIDDQNAGNFAYDAIGNLTKDEAEGITDISWTVYGKVDKVSKDDGSSITFKYDAAGNRVKKIVENAEGMVVTTYYVRDASGNILSVYTEQEEPIDGGADKVLTLAEQPIYGSSRVGLHEPYTEMQRLRTLDGMEPFLINNSAEYSGALAQWTLPVSDDNASYLARVDMRTNEPEVPSSSQQPIGPTNLSTIATVTNESGRLLFSAVVADELNGAENVLMMVDANGHLMPGATNMQAETNSVAMATRMPGADNRYVLFTFNTDGNLFAHIVDMQQPGNGDVENPLGDWVSGTQLLTGNFMPCMALVADTRDETGLVHLYMVLAEEGNKASLMSYVYNAEAELESYKMYDAVDAVISMPAYLELNADGNLMALTVHKGEQEPLYGMATGGVDMHIYQTSVNDHTLSYLRTLSLSNEQLLSSTVWGSNNTLYCTATNITSGNKLYAVQPLTNSPAPAAYPEELAYNSTLQRANSGKIYLAEPNAKSLAMVGADALVADAITMGGVALAGTLPALPHRVSTANSNNYLYARTLGKKQYEIADHLGNVRATISDRRFRDADNNTYYPELLSTNTYYPFGMGISSLSVQGGYRFGFQGQEKDDEIKGEGNSINYKFRPYDPRVIRFLSVDPLWRQFPYWTPYQFAGLTPIQGKEYDGLRVYYFNREFGANLGHPQLGGIGFVYGNAVANDDIGRTYFKYKKRKLKITKNEAVFGITLGEAKFHFGVDLSSETFEESLKRGPVPSIGGGPGVLSSIDIRDRKSGGKYLGASFGFGLGASHTVFETEVIESFSTTKEDRKHIMKLVNESGNFLSNEDKPQYYRVNKGDGDYLGYKVNRTIFGVFDTGFKIETDIKINNVGDEESRRWQTENYQKGVYKLNDK